MEKLLDTNNARKMAGEPLWRKKDKRKRKYTRDHRLEELYAICAFLGTPGLLVGRRPVNEE